MIEVGPRGEAAVQLGIHYSQEATVGENSEDPRPERSVTPSRVEGISGLRTAMLRCEANA